MTIKLYEVETEIIMYVLAHDEADAREIAIQNIEEEAGNLGSRDFDVNEANRAYHADWSNGTPYYDDNDDLEGLDDMTVKEIIAEMKTREAEQAKREEFEKKQIPLF